VEERDPCRIKQVANRRQPSKAPYDRIVGVHGLVDGVGPETDVDESPDREDVAGRDDEHVESIADLRGRLPIQGERIRGAVGDERQKEGKDGRERSHVPQSSPRLRGNVAARLSVDRSLAR
jgi:hypothetical protein